MSNLHGCHYKVRSNPRHAKSHIVRDCFVLRNDGYLILIIKSIFSQRRDA